MKQRWVSLGAAALAAAVFGPAALAQTTVPASPAPPTASSAPPASPAPVPYAGQQPQSAATPSYQSAFTAPSCSSCAACPTCADQQPEFFTPFMLGDFVGIVANQFSDVKIAEGESPRPVDRVFIKFNFYNDLNESRWSDPRLSIHNIELYRYTFGFEKTFFDQNVSLGVRLPFYTLEAEGKDVVLTPDPATGALVPGPGGPGINDTELGNLTAILKAVVWQDRQTGSLLSTGATLSFPTATSKLINPGQSTLAYIQPYGGFILQDGDMFLQGFTSITLPIASAESTVFFADLGAGYYVYRNHEQASFLTGVAPTLEVHFADALRQPDFFVNDFGLFDDIKVPTTVDVTLGSTFEFAGGAVFGAGLCVPVTGPKSFDFELIGQLNYRF
ncbi:MAG TPA: hypothetical protein VMS17_19145 [Gemmataceae bacterium]|nr:hypothetical protein [Gemmataceae bacterium]